jgi:hypothetical protein
MPCTPFTGGGDQDKVRERLEKNQVIIKGAWGGDGRYAESI